MELAVQMRSQHLFHRPANEGNHLDPRRPQRRLERGRDGAADEQLCAESGQLRSPGGRLGGRQFVFARIRRTAAAGLHEPDPVGYVEDR